MTAQALLSRYAQAQAVSFTDERIKARYVSYPLPVGTSGTMRGYLVQPSGTDPFPAALVIHENRGLNPCVEDIARRLAVEGFLALAPDGLAPVGGYPGNDDDGRDLQARLDQGKLRTDMANSALHIVNALVGSLVPITHDAPEPTNLLAPQDFSRFAVTSGLPSVSHGVLNYDNLFYPDGSPPTASDYTAHGGFLEIYGLMFNIGGGAVVNFWSNGAGGDGIVDYGVGVATSGAALDYVAGGVSAVAAGTSVPEPGSLALLGGGLLGLLGTLARRRSTSA